MRFYGALVCPLLFTVASCVSTQAGGSATMAQDTRTSPATEAGCPYAEPVQPALAAYKVTLEFRVRGDGSVEPASITPIVDHHDTTDQGYVDQARRIASRCTFEPATADGEPVVSTVRKRFYFEGGA